MMNKEPTIEEHVAFRKLLEQKHPEALNVHAAFTASRDHAAFSAGVIKVVRKGPPADSTHGGQTQRKAPASRQICRAFASKGKCAHGSACKFSHDAPEAAGTTVPRSDKKVAQQSSKTPASATKQPNGQKPQDPSSPAVTAPPTAVASRLDATATPTIEKLEGAAAEERKSRFLGLFGVRHKGEIPGEAPHPVPAAQPPAPPVARGNGSQGSTATSAPFPPLGAPPGNLLPVGSMELPPATPPRTGGIERGLEDLLLDSPPARSLDPSRSGFGTGPPFGLGNSESASAPPPGGLGGAMVPGPDVFANFAPGFLGGHAQHPPLPPHLMYHGHPGQPPFPPPAELHLHSPFPGPLGPPGPPGPPGFERSFLGGNGLHLQQQQLPPGPFGQSYQTMFAAPPQVPPPSIAPSDTGFRGVSVHDMLSRASAQPLSPSTEERSRQLKELLSLQSNAGNADSAQAPNGGFAFAAPLSSAHSGPVGGESAQKTRALMSLLRSAQPGPGASGLGTSPATQSTPQKATRDNAVSTVGEEARGMPPAPRQAPVSAPAAPVTDSPFSTPVKSKPRSLTATDLEEGIGNSAVTATPARKASFFRNTRHQVGSLHIAVAGEVRRHHYMRPSANMLVHWQLPEAEYHALMNRPRVLLVIGLVRYGSYTNSPCFVSKPLEGYPKLVRDQDGNAFFRGAVAFHAPKSAGQFVYRMFDESSKEAVLTTLATSPVFTVDLVDFHVNHNLRHILEALNEKSKLKGISQMPTVLRGIRNAGRNDRNANDRADVMLNEALATVLRATEEASAVLQAWQTRKREEEEMKARGEEFVSTLTDEARGNYKHALRVHAEAYETIVAVMESRILWNMVAPERRSLLALFQFLYCPHLQRSFHSAADLQTARIAEFGFDCDPRVLDPVPPQVNAAVCARVSATIDALLPSLLPRSDFQALRESAAAKLQLALLTEGAIPQGTQVALFGSSHNSFGSDGADLDTTLLFPPHIHVTLEDKPTIIERLGVVLDKIGMAELSVRSTARIPIVMFRDPLHGLECDISIQNQLAVANTQLLRTYGSIDPRVRQLVFLVKYWAKRRHLNSPSDGTLSSYGFILCLIHFLQNRPIPLVPNLQTLPPAWSGSRQEIPGEAPTAPHFINDAFIGPHRPSVHLQQQLLAQSPTPLGASAAVPKISVTSADGIRCNAYFYAPSPSQSDLLAAYARQNTETVGELLVEFFRYFSWTFDLRHSVVSIRQPRGLSKVDKAEQDGWPQNDNLAIEDPFETHYDVAHVIKAAQMAYFRKELLRASTLITRMFAPAAVPDSLPASVASEDFLHLLCAPCEPPAFTAVAKEKAVAAGAAVDRAAVEAVAEAPAV